MARQEAGSITWSSGLHEGVFPTPFTPARVDLIWETADPPDIDPPQVIPGGFKLTARINSNSCTVWWVAQENPLALNWVKTKEDWTCLKQHLQKSRRQQEGRGL